MISIDLFRWDLGVEAWTIGTGEGKPRGHFLNNPSTPLLCAAKPQGTKVGSREGRQIQPSARSLVIGVSFLRVPFLGRSMMCSRVRISSLGAAPTWHQLGAANHA